MAKCKNNNCDNDLTGKQRTYCSDRCRKVVSRTKPDKIDAQVRHLSGLEPSRTNGKMPTNYGLEDCDCQMCRANRLTGNKRRINHKEYKDCDQLVDNEMNRVSLPGDVDYDGVCLGEKYKDRRIARARQTQYTYTYMC